MTDHVTISSVVETIDGKQVRVVKLEFPEHATVHIDWETACIIGDMGAAVRAMNAEDGR